MIADQVRALTSASIHFRDNVHHCCTTKIAVRAALDVASSRSTGLRCHRFDERGVGELYEFDDLPILESEEVK